MLVLAITVGGIAVASIGAGRISKTANTNARLNVAMTAFAEVVKSLPYDDCTLTGADYQNAFESGDDDVALKKTYDVEMVVDSVDPGPECYGDGVGVDSGVQTLNLQLREVGSHDVLLERKVVKRSPDPAATDLDFHIADPTEHVIPGDASSPLRFPHLQRSSPNDPLVVWGLQAYGESQIFKYEWWCGGAWEREDPQPDPAPSADFTTYAPDDSFPECQYPARAEGDTSDDAYVVVALRVTELGTGRVATTSERFLKTTTPVPHKPLLAQITVTSPGECTSAVPCLLGAGNAVDVTVASSGPDPVDGAIITWEWDFGDGTPAVFCSVSGADPTGQACRIRTHRYEGGGDFPVTLTVSDNFGATGHTTRNVRIGGEPIVKPTIEDGQGRSGVTANPMRGVSGQLTRGTPGWWGQRVAFDASGSYANGHTPGVGSPPGGIVRYEWDFGDGTPLLVGTAPQVTYEYVTQIQRDFVVRLTVFDQNGFSMSATVTVNIAPIQPPIGITVTEQLGDIPAYLCFCSGRNARFGFQWTNVQRAPGDTVRYDVAILRVNGYLCSPLGVNPNRREFSFAAGDAGAVQQVVAQFSSSPRGYNGVCTTDTYAYQVRTVIQNARGTFTSDWSPQQPLNPGF